MALQKEFYYMSFPSLSEPKALRFGILPAMILFCATVYSASAGIVPPDRSLAKWT